MNVGKHLSAVTAVIVVAIMAPFAVAIDDITWTSALTGSQQWQVDGNWAPATFPNSGDDNAIIAVSSDLTLDVGPADVAVVALTLDGTNAGTDIDVTSSGGRLLLQNDDNNTSTDPEPGNPDVDDILVLEGVNHGRVYVTTSGVAGSTNTISAPIRLSNNGFLEGVDFFGTQSITLSGAMDIVGAAANDSGSLRSYLPTGAKVHVTGNINLTDAGDNTTGRFLVLNNYYTTDHADPPRGMIEISGTISGAGGIIAGWTWDVDGTDDGTDDTLYDPADPPGVPLGTVILSGDNSFTEDVLQARGNLVLAHDGALGVDNTFRQAGPAGNSKEVGYNVISNSDDRNIANNVGIAQWTTVRGATGIAGLEGVGDHSIEFSGEVVTSNTRGWVNLLPSGKTLTLSGPQYPLEGGDNVDPDRIYTIDGTGKTVVTGGIHNRHPINNGMAPISRGHLRVRGSGTVVVDFDPSNAPDTDSDYAGYTWMEGGNLHFGDNDDLSGSAILSSGGAVGVDAGVINNSTFLGLLTNSSNPNFTPVDNAPFFLTYDVANAIFTRYSEGGLMLGTVAGVDEYTQNLNFTSGDLARAANMTLAARETGSSYTGTITPSTSVVINPNTYQLGGGSGTLTLPNANQLTGARNLLVTNGGEVWLQGSNNYTGTTKVIGKYRGSLQEYAAVNSADPDGDGKYGETPVRVAISSTLTVSSLANGGSASSIGSSSNAAGNLVIQGSTFKYVGGATSTNRLFTVGTAGATLDASGSGAVDFNNTGALAIDTAEDRNGVISISVPGNGNNTIFGVPQLAFYNAPFPTDDLVPGMKVFTVEGDFTDDDSPVVITSIPSPEVVQVAEIDLVASEEDNELTTTPNRWPGYTEPANIRSIQFGPAPARRLTLTGSNTGSNTLAPLVGNASDIGEATGTEVTDGHGTVGITKTGVGKWILTGNNTYTGTTNVEAGTLLVNGNQTAATGLTTVSAGATLGGTGTIGGAIVNNGSVAPGASVGTLSALGDVTMGADSHFAVEISGLNADQLAVTGNLDLTALGNALDVTGAGSNPAGWIIATYAGMLTGEFESITAGFFVDYGAGTNSQITLSALTGVPGDYNKNGKVDAPDYTIWRNHLGQSFQLDNEGGITPGLVTAADYDFWKSHFGEPAGAGAGGLAAGATVPEPASYLLAILGLFVIIIVRKRGVYLFDTPRYGH